MSRNLHEYGYGRVDVVFLEKKHYEKMKQLTLLKRDKYEANTPTYHRWYRNYILLKLGVYLGCRIEVLLQLTPKHLKGGYYRIQEFKTGKTKNNFKMREDVYEEVQEFIKYLGIGEHGYIFKTSLKKDKPLTRQQAYNIINDLAKEAGVNYSVGCHSLRKSHGRYLYDETKDIYLVQRDLGHTSTKTTEQYICLNQEEINKKKTSYYC